MPYQGPNDASLPEHVKALPEDLRKQWIEVFNSVFERTKDEGAAMRQANGVTAKRAQMAEIALLPIRKLDTDKYGHLDFGPEFAAQLQKNFEDRVLKIDPVIDAEHQRGKAQGWIKRLWQGSFKHPVSGADVPSLMAEVDWTEAGAAAIKGGEFRYLSPEIGSYKDEETGKTYYPVLRSAALTNTPVLKLLPEVSLSDTGPPGAEKTVPLEVPEMRLDEGSDIGSLFDELLSDMEALAQKGEAAWKGVKGAPAIRTYLKEVRAKLGNMRPATQMADPPKPDEKGLKMNEEIRKLLQLSDEPTDEQITQALYLFAEKAAEEPVKKLAETAKELDDLKASMSGKDREHAEVIKRLTELETERAKDKAEIVIEKALTEGRMLPAHRERWEKLYLADPEGTAGMISELPKVIDTGIHGNAGGADEGPEKALDAEVRRVMSEGKIEDYGEALLVVCSERPELAKAREEVSA